MALHAPRTLLLALALAAVPAAASAAAFDEATGMVSLDGAALAWDFESLQSLPPQVVLVATNLNRQEVGPEIVAPMFGDKLTPIQGAKGLWLGSTIERLDLGFSEPEALMGRRVDISFWYRPQGIGAVSALTWTVDDRVVGNIRLQPTGRRTDDGWIELSTGPVDFALGGRLLPSLAIACDRIRSYGGYYSGGMKSDPKGLVLLDALEIADLGPAAVPDARCALASEPADCGEYGMCQLGRCVDAAAVAGRVPAEVIKEEYLDRRIFEVGHFFGNRVLDKTRPAFLERMEAARQATSALGFWGNVIDAYQSIEDAHGSPPYPSMTERPGIGMCLHLGEANRLPEAASWPARRLPMVFYADPAGAASTGLLRGDVLTTVDDLPVELWTKLAGPRLQHFGSPLARAVATAPDVPAAAARAGARLGFARCPADIAALRPCKPEEIVKVEVDFYALFGEALWESGDVSGWLDDEFACDYRFNRLLGEVPTGDYYHVAMGDDGPVRVLEANGVPYPEWPYAEWGQTVRAALQPTADYFVIDERTGHGGTFYGVDAICAPFSNPENPVVTEVLPALDGALDEESLGVFQACWRQAGNVESCGSYVRYSEGDYEDFPGFLVTRKAAVLTSLDVSGNDWVTKLAKMRPGLTRIFGPCPTFGGFGFVNSMAGYLGEMYGGAGQVADSILYRGTRTSLALESGPGVEPDEVVFQTQSDAIAGKDTLYERAKEWLLQ